MVERQQILGGVPARTGIRVMRMAVGVLAIGLLLGGCGQKGPLYLPDPSTPTSQTAKPTR